MTSRFLAATCVLLVLAATQLVSGQTTCRDESGRPVDFWFAIKAPDGTSYAYSDEHGGDLVVSEFDMANATHGALSYTLQQVYQKDDIGYALYNDESPAKVTYSGRAHSKGVMGFDSSSGDGFWLVHSVPCFPPVKSAAGYQGLGKIASTIYGQSFLCLSLPRSQLELAAGNMQINWPHLHDSQMPSGLNTAMPNMTSWINDDQHVLPATTAATPLRTTGGKEFFAFAKNKAWNSDLYEQLVAPALKTGLLTETWQNGAFPNVMPAFCPPKYGFEVANVAEVSILGMSPWKHSHDHSKWAVASGSAQWACIGDINRQFSQAKRGGGTVCAQNPTFVNSLKKVVSSAESC